MLRYSPFFTSLLIMPTINGKKYPYTNAGKAAAKKAATKKKPKSHNHSAHKH